MLDKTEVEESSSIVKRLISEGKMVKPEEKRTDFFLGKSLESFYLAERVLKISEDEKDALSSYMWVVGIAYYSMFFAATALLAYFNHKINEERSIHKLTYHALVYYFLVDDNKLQKHFVQEYKDACEETEELLQMSELRAFSLVKNFDYEQEKRKKFTYEMGAVAELNKARTSVKRAREFLTEIRKIIRK